MYVGEKRLGAFGQVFLVITSDTGPVESILPLSHTHTLFLSVSTSTCATRPRGILDTLVVHGRF